MRKAFYEVRTRWLRAIANSLRNEGHITIGESEEKNQGSVTRGAVKVVKEIIMEESVVRDWVCTTLDLDVCKTVFDNWMFK